MAARLKAIIAFVGVPPGGVASAPHGLSMTPDVVSPSNSQFGVGADATLVTVTNNGVGAADCDVLCEVWHSIERAFAGYQTFLTPRPFVVGGGGGSVGPTSPLREIKAAFDHTFSGALDFGALAPGDSVINVQLVIDEPFDDPAALVSLGLVSNPDGILATTNVDPGFASTYGAQENIRATSVDAFRLKVFPFASTQGAGRVVALVG